MLIFDTSYTLCCSLCLFHRQVSISDTELNKSKGHFCPYTEAVCSSCASTNASCPAPQMDPSTSESSCVVLSVTVGPVSKHPLKSELRRL